MANARHEGDGGADHQGQARLSWLVDLSTQVIEDARFLAFGSLASHPLMDAFTELARGRTITDACALLPELKRRKRIISSRSARRVAQTVRLYVCLTEIRSRKIHPNCLHCELEATACTHDLNGNLLPIRETREIFASKQFHEIE